MNFKAKPVEVEAFQITNNTKSNNEVMAWCGGTEIHSVVEGVIYHIPNSSPGTRKQGTAAKVGDWVVKRPDGYDVMSDETFNAVYEPTKPAPIKTEPAKTAESAKS